MELVTGAMGTLLPKLADLIKGEYNLQKGTRGEIMVLMTELEYMEAALLEVADSEAPGIDQPPPGVLRKLWARDVRELSYDLEDCIDTFMARVDRRAQHSFWAFIQRCKDLVTRAKVRHKIGVEVEDFKKRIKDVHERMERYNMDSVAAANSKPLGPSVDVRRLLAIYTEATKLVGIEGKSGKVVKLLMEGDDEASKRQLKTVSVVGFGGLGKTTLAKIVYDKLRREFDCGAFVSVSHTPNIKNIFESMFDQFRQSQAPYDPTLGEDQLINQLRDFLRDKRYLVVVDDLWKIDVWKTIQYALIENERGSRVISTTRIYDVAENVGGVYKLQPLSRADSRKLFYLRIFGGIENNCLPNELVKVSEKILKKCGGVPLAIITIASLLANRKENKYQYWSKVYQRMGSGLEDDPGVKAMRRILSISYYELSPHLKTCMLYLSSYPEDAEIRTEHLIQKWMGEGFLRKEEGKSFYEVGEDYVDELINRSMVQVQPPPINYDSNKAAYFRVHDMIHDLITQLSNEDGFLTTLDSPQPMPLKKIRRLSFRTSNENDIKQLSSTGSLDHVRSLTVSSEAIDLLPTLLAFGLLRVLDLSYCKQVDNHYFRGICNLFHLRYLGLSFTGVTEIPKQIRNLTFLQVLDIYRTEIVELPPSFVQLRQLMHLRFFIVNTIPDEFDYLKSLQGLNGNIRINSPTTLTVLGRLAQLTSLGLWFNDWDESYKQPLICLLSSLVNLKYLTINGKDSIDLDSSCEKLSPGLQQIRTIEIRRRSICSVPKWISMLCFLSTLHISVPTLGEKDLQILGSLSSLSYLALTVEEQTKGRDERLVISNVYPFLCLTKLRIFNTVEVMFAQGAMQNLQTVELRFEIKQMLNQFGDYDCNLENLPSLQSVIVCLSCRNAMPEEVEAAKAAIRHSVELNPSKPSLKLQTLSEVKVQLDSEWSKNKAFKVPFTGEEAESITYTSEDGYGKMIVVGLMDMMSIINKLREAGISAAPWTQPISFPSSFAASEPTREESVYRAKLAEQAERYEEMVEFMERVVRAAGGAGGGEELSVEERNLLSVAYKNVIAARRASWRIISSIEQKEEGRGNEAHAASIRTYRAKLEAEIARICNGILMLLDSHLIPSAGAAESKVFYLKMKGDYHRHMAEFKSGTERKEAAESTMNTYKAAQDIALADLAPTHPIRLGLALNFSVFYYETLNSPDRACNLAKQAFDEAISELDSLGEESYKDSTLILQLLRDNLTLWTSDTNEDGGDEIKEAAATTESGEGQ